MLWTVKLERALEHLLDLRVCGEVGLCELEQNIEAFRPFVQLQMRWMISGLKNSLKQSIANFMSSKLILLARSFCGETLTRVRQRQQRANGERTRQGNLLIGHLRRGCLGRSSSSGSTVGGTTAPICGCSNNLNMQHDSSRVGKINQESYTTNDVVS